MKIGVLGGTFDPPHIGHLRAAVEAKEALGLDRVLLVVANVPWQKVGARSITPAKARLQMVRSAAEGLVGLEPCDLEIRRGGDSFTIDTLRELRRAQPTDELVLLAGADVIGGLQTWHDPIDLPDLAQLAIFDRPGAPVPLVVDDAGWVVPPPEVAPGVVWPARRVPVSRLDVSSSDVRARVRTARSIALLVPTSVAVMIESQGIYREEP